MSEKVNKRSYKDVLLNIPEIVYNLEEGTLEIKKDTVTEETVTTTSKTDDVSISPFTEKNVTIFKGTLTEPTVIEVDVKAKNASDDLSKIMPKAICTNLQVIDVIIKNILDSCPFLRISLYNPIVDKVRASLEKLLLNYALDINYSAFTNHKGIGGGAKTGTTDMTLFVHKVTKILLDVIDYIVIKHNGEFDTPVLPVKVCKCNTKNNYDIYEEIDATKHVDDELKGLHLNGKPVNVSPTNGKSMKELKSTNGKSLKKMKTTNGKSMKELKSMISYVNENIGNVGRFTTEAVFAILCVLELSKYMLYDLVKNNENNKDTIMQSFDYDEESYQNMCGYVLTKYRIICFQLEMLKILYEQTQITSVFTDRFGNKTHAYSYPSVMLSQPSCAFCDENDPLMISYVNTFNLICYCSHFHSNYVFSEYIRNLYNMNSSIYDVTPVELKCNVKSSSDDKLTKQHNFMIALKTVACDQHVTSKAYLAYITIQYESRHKKTGKMQLFSKCEPVWKTMTEFDENKFKAAAEKLKEDLVYELDSEGNHVNFNVTSSISARIMNPKKINDANAKKNNCVHCIINLEFPNKPILPNLIYKALIDLCNSNFLSYEDKEYNIQLIEYLLYTHYVNTLRCVHDDRVHSVSKMINMLVNNKIISKDKAYKIRYLLDIGFTALEYSNEVNAHVTECQRIQFEYLTIVKQILNIPHIDVEGYVERNIEIENATVSTL